MKKLVQFLCAIFIVGMLAGYYAAAEGVRVFNPPFASGGSISPSTVTIPSGTGSACFSADNPTLVVNCATHRVGVGTASPGTALEVKGPNTGYQASVNAPSGGQSGYGYLINNVYSWETVQDNADANKWKLNYWNGGSTFTAVSVDPGNNLSVYLTPSIGNVGIGNTSPAAKLDVTGGINASTGVVAGSDFTNGGFRLLSSSGTNSVVLARDSANNLFVGDIGNNLLDVSIYGSGSQRLTVKSGTGNVGVGTTAPATLLHVSSGTLTIDGTGGNINLAGTLKLTAPSTGGALCLNSSHLVTKCTSIVDASGNCTCP